MPTTLPGLPSPLSGHSRQQTTITPQEEESIARMLGRKAMGGVAAAGNALFLPGSMVRDVIAGENPFDQLLTPFSDENRTSGRDLLRKAGWAGPKDNWKNFLGGMATEIVTDPLTWIHPTGALTKGGMAVKNAGLLDKTRIMATQAAGLPINRIMGPRQAMAATTLGDVLRSVAGTSQEQALRTAASKLGVDLVKSANQPLRGALGIGAFGSPRFVAGFGPRAQKYLKGWDVAGRAIRYGKVPGTDFSPTDSLARMFNPKLGNIPGEAMQVFARQGFNLREAARADGASLLAQSLPVLERHGWHLDQYADDFRTVLEAKNPRGVVPNMPPEVRRVAYEWRRFHNRLKRMAESEGAIIDTYMSPYVRHWPRQGARAEFIPAGAATSKPLSATNPFAARRNPMFSPWTDKAGTVHAIPDETRTIRKVIMDPDIKTVIDNQGEVNDIARVIQQKYGHVIPRYFADEQVVAGQVKQVRRNRHKALAKWIAEMDPEHRAAGFFANHPLLEGQSYAAWTIGQAGGLRTVREYLGSRGALLSPSRVANQRGFATLAETLNDMPGKIHEGRFAALLHGERLAKMNAAEQAAHLADVSQWTGKAANQLGADDFVKYTLAQRLTEDQAKHLGRIITGFTSPEPVNQIVKSIDGVTNLWKSFQTTIAPAFGVRNWISGQMQNWVNGMWSPKSFKATWQLLHGQTVTGASQIPIIREMAASRGITNLTDDIATNMLGELAYANNMTSRYAGEALSRPMTGVFQPQLLEDVARDIPRRGFKATTVGQIGRTLAGREPGTGWLNPRIRGVFGQKETRWAPMAAGEQFNAMVEGHNRIAPFIDQLMRGINPAEAARRVGSAQVFYDSRYFTPIERQVLQRIFPFYKFQSRMPVWVFQELAARPSGKLAQIIRMTGGLHKPSAMTPEYVQETLSIPFGKQPDGSQTYLSGMGMMHEDPLSYLSAGGPGRFFRGIGLETASRMNPLLKMPMEWTAGQSFFQKGPMGGRPLEDMDPTLGRLLANLKGQKKPVKWPGSEGHEFLLANLIGRPLSTARTLSYPLADPSGKEIARTLANTLTGFRFTRVRPAAQDAMLREQLKQLMKTTGAKEFTKTYIPEDVEQEMTPQELEDARKLEALMHLLSMRAKARRMKGQ